MNRTPNIRSQKQTNKPNRVKNSVEPEGMLVYCSKYYVGDNDPSHPYISPLFGDLKGLPPLLMFVGDEEFGLDDSIRFAEKAMASGVDVKLSIGKGQVHCYPLLPDFIPESKQAMAEISAFIHNTSASQLSPVWNQARPFKANLLEVMNPSEILRLSGSN